jgi:hypothetical protein
MGDQLEQVLLEKLDNNGNPTGECEFYPRVSAEIMLNYPNTKWRLADQPVEKAAKAKKDAGS